MSDSITFTMSDYVARLRADAADFSARIDEKAREGTLRAILTRIKSARIPRAVRDDLCRTVRNLASDDRLDPKAVRGILDIVFLHEMARRKPLDPPELLSGEDSVEEEIEDIRALREERRRCKDSLDELGRRFSTIA